MTSAGNIPDSLVDNKPVLVYLPLLASKEMFGVHGIYRETTLPNFDLHFQTGILPVTSLDLKGTVIISTDEGRLSFVEARIRAVQNERVLEMVRVNALDHRQMREYFRVNATIAVVARSLHPAPASERDESWALAGETIDISGNGILAVFPAKPPLDQPVRLEITLPAGSRGNVSVLARPVRSRDAGNGNYEVAYQFEEVPPHDRNRIIGCCLVLQRRRLPLQSNA